MWELEWTEAATDDVSRLDRPTRERIHQAMRRYAQTGHGDIRRIHGREGEWGFRIGKWRVIYRYLQEDRIIRVLRVQPRGGAYKK